MDDLWRITDRLYAAAAEPDEWPQALEAMADLLAADHAILQAGDADAAKAPVLSSARVDEGDLARSYAAHEGCNGGPLSAMPLPIGRAFMRADLIPDRDFARSHYYNEVVRPLNGFHSVTLRQEGAAASFLLSFCRPQACDNFDGREAGTLQTLLPHLTTAMTLHYRLCASEHRHGGLANLIDRLDAGVILADAAGRPLLINARATRIAAEADGLALDDSGIAAATPAATRQLREAIAAMVADSAVEERRLRLPRPSHRPSLLLTLLPVWRLGMDALGVQAPRVAILIKEPDAPVALDRLAIAETFHLTKRESEVAAQVAVGHDLRTVAVSLGLGLGTVRHHLKRVYEKTGANSQAKLVALLRGFADPLQ